MMAVKLIMAGIATTELIIPKTAAISAAVFREASCLLGGSRLGIPPATSEAGHGACPEGPDGPSNGSATPLILERAHIPQIERRRKERERHSQKKDIKKHTRKEREGLGLGETPPMTMTLVM